MLEGTLYERKGKRIQGNIGLKWFYFKRKFSKFVEKNLVS